VTAAIRTEGLTKRYGRHPAITELNLTIERGEIFGYLGPNGAGKTTTIRVLLDAIRPTAGRAEILGLDSHAQCVEVHRRTGYLPGDISLYDTLTGREHLAYFAHLRGGVDWGYVEQLVKRFDLDLSRPIRHLSKGNRQKVGLVQAFMHRPELLILDEPTSGLDPLVQQEFQRLLLDVKKEGGTVLLSSHVLSEVERVGDRVGILRSGRLILTGEVDEIKAKARRRLEVRFGAPVSAESFQALPGVQVRGLDNGTAVFDVEGSMDPLVKALARFEVTSLSSHEPDLEEIFLEYYRGGDEHAG
jgi:ABC-2 type transport system ATP-binding protein